MHVLKNSKYKLCLVRYKKFYIFAVDISVTKIKEPANKTEVLFRLNNELQIHSR